MYITSVSRNLICARVQYQGVDSLLYAAYRAMQLLTTALSGYYTMMLLTVFFVASQRQSQFISPIHVGRDNAAHPNHQLWR